MQRLTLRRDDGSRILALWRPVSVWDTSARKPVAAPAVPAVMSFHLPVRDVTVCGPSASDRPVLRATAKRLSLYVGGDVVMVGMR